MITLADYKYRPGDRIVQAIYSTGLGRHNDHNPLVAALQPRFTKEAIGAAMTWWPDFNAEDREKDAEERYDSVMELVGCFETLPQHLDIAKAIMSNLRLGYRGRDRFVHGFTSEIEALTKKLETTERLAPPPEVTGLTMVLFGPPGAGKTTFVNRLSVLLPQVIQHTEFQGREFPCRQVTYVHVVAQANWTDRALAQAICEKFDQCAGTQYAVAAAKAGASFYQYILQFNLAAHNHALGMVIVDEVQLFADNQALLNFLLNFNTLVRIPLVLVGTPSTQALMQQDPRFMRRADSFFDPEFKRFLFPVTTPVEYDSLLKDENGSRDPWTFFVEAFWGMQYTANFTPLTHALSFDLHYYSAGLIDYAMKLFTAAQLLRVGSEKDYLDAEAFKEAYFTCFRTSIPYLEAVRNNDQLELKRWEDYSSQSAAEVAKSAAQARIAARLKDSQSRLEEARRQNRRAKGKPDPKPPKPAPIDKAELPEAPADEFTK